MSETLPYRRRHSQSRSLSPIAFSRAPTRRYRFTGTNASVSWNAKRQLNSSVEAQSEPVAHHRNPELGDTIQVLPLRRAKILPQKDQLRHAGKPCSDTSTATAGTYSPSPT